MPDNFTWETVGLPLVGGIDLNTRARLVDKVKLLKAENVYYPKVGGPQIRRGHDVTTVEDQGTSYPPDWYLRGIPDPKDNVYGVGVVTESSGTEGTSANIKSVFPIAGTLKGLATRDKEILSWDGHRLFTYHASDNKTSVVQGDDKYQDGSVATTRAFMPTAKSSAVAKTSYAQNFADAADSGVIRVVVVRRDSTSINEVFCYDSVHGSLRFSASVGPTTGMVKVINVGAHIHIYGILTSTSELNLWVIHESNYTVNTPVVLGTCLPGFDVTKVDESLTLVAKRTGANLNITYVNSTGTVNFAVSEQNKQLDINHFFYGLTVPDFIAVSAHKVADTICVMWRDNTAVKTMVKMYTLGGVVRSTGGLVSDTAGVKHITCTHSGIPLTNPTETFGGYIPAAYFHLFEDVVDTVSSVRTYRGAPGGASLINTQYHVHLASKAFTVGTVGFAYVCYPTTLQTQYLLVDHRLGLHGRLEYGTAVARTTSDWLATINYRTAVRDWETYKFHCALTYKTRVITTGTSTSFFFKIFQEPSTKFVEMDFMPKVTSAQIGRSTYFSGALMKAYDGRNLTEANFIAGPEGVTATSNAGPGAMVAGAVYRYRVYLVHKNAQGEEVRSPAFQTDPFTVGAGHIAMTVTGKTVPTNRVGSYFLVYRNENNGVLWYLVSNRDPSSPNCPKNDHTVSSTWVFNDPTGDTPDLFNAELDPANVTSWIQPWCAPSCEMITVGKDRLWITGGEIPDGQVWASRLMDGNQVPGFSPILTVDVDKGVEPVNAIGFVGDYAFVFKANSTHILTGEFSGNVFNGNGVLSRKAQSEIGAISPYVVRTANGCVFQSSSGYRMITGGGELVYVGRDVDQLSGTLAGMVLNLDDRNIRMYQSDQDSPVMDYTTGDWTTFTLRPQAAIVNPVTGLAVLAVGNKLYFEVDDKYTDGDVPYKATVRTSWLGSGLGGFQRIRRIGGVGEFLTHHTVDINVYMDELESAVETFKWQTSQDLSEMTWGYQSWGDFHWGSLAGANSPVAPDSVWRFRFRLARQKCSAVSIELTFDSASGACAVPTALMLELGNKNTMDKIPTRTRV